MTDNDLFWLLDTRIPDYEQAGEQLDTNEVIETVQRNPQSAARKYYFTDGFVQTFHDYPLHQAIRLGANLDVVEALYNSYPLATQAKWENNGEENYELYVKSTALHFAFDRKSPKTEVASFLINKWPEAAQEKDCRGFVPLHYACRNNAPVELVSSLLNVWPDAAREKNDYGETPLHLAVGGWNLENIALLLDHYPDALKEDALVDGQTPLYYACHQDAPEVLLLLLETWPEAVVEKNTFGMTLLDISYEEEHSDEVQMILSYYSHLCGGTMNYDISKKMMDYFVEIGWWDGIALVLDRYPPCAKKLNLDTNAFPTFLSVVGRRCRMKTMWQVMSNEPDIMEGIL